MTPVPGPDSQKRVFCRHQRQDNNKSRYFSCPGIFFFKTLTQLGRTHALFVPDCRDWQSLNHSSLSLVHPPPFFLFLFLFSDLILFLYFYVCLQVGSSFMPNLVTLLSDLPDQRNHETATDTQCG